MKVSLREIIALTILLVVGLFYILYTFVYTPLLENINESKLILEQEQTAYNEYNDIIKNNKIEKLEEEKKQILNAINILVKPFLSDTKEAKIVGFIRDISSKQGVNISGITFNKIELTDTTPLSKSAVDNTYVIGSIVNEINHIEKTQVVSSTEQKSTTEESIQTKPSVAWLVDVSINIEEVSYEQIMKFIKAIEETNSLIYINSADIDKEEKGLSTQFNYYFIAIDKIGELDGDIAIAKPAIAIGKSNPFAN